MGAGAMTKEDILRMAREAGFDTYNESIYVWARQETITKELTAFAALAAAAEREACAKIADGQLKNQTLLLTDPPKSGAAWTIAAAIRARGENK
jgi:hypothetical protein